eukprot:gene11494-11637_t
MRSNGSDVLATVQKSPKVERSIGFFGVLASKAPADSEAAAALVEELLQRLACHLSAADKMVRYRAAQLLQLMLASLPDSLLLEESVVDALRSSLTERLQDKLPAVRAEAVRAVCHLLEADEEDAQAPLDAILRLLKSDKSKDVRSAIVAALPLDESTLPVLLERVRDISPNVRKALVLRLRDTPLRLLSIKQRAEVIQQVLQDRDAVVTEAAGRMLGEWLNRDCRSDPLQLLQLLDVETYTEAASPALNPAIINGNVQGGAEPKYKWPSAVSQAGRRCLCEWLRVLERVLPETAHEVMQLVMRHAAAGPDARFATAQLLMIAASCVEWTDAASREVAGPYLQQLVSLNPSSQAEQDEGKGGDCAANSVHVETRPPSQGSGFFRRDYAGGLQLVGNGGDGLYEGCLVQLVLQVQGGAGSGFTASLLEGLAPLAAAAGVLSKPQADGAMLFSVGALEASCALQMLAYVQLMLQQLPNCRPLQHYEAAAGYGSCTIISFSALWELLLLLALKQDHAAVRAKAVECIALYALAASGSNLSLLTSAVQLLGPMVAAGGCSATRTAAVKGLVDIALIFGPAAVDSVLRAPAAAAAAAVVAPGPPGLSAGGDEDHQEGISGQEQSTTVLGSAGQGGHAAAGDSCDAGGKGLVELLMSQAEQLLSELQATAAAPRTAGKARRNTASNQALAAGTDTLSSAAADLLAAVAESLCKFLLYQRVWLPRYKSSPIAPLHNPLIAVSALPAGQAEPEQYHADAGAGPATPATLQPTSSVVASSTVPLPPDSQQLQVRLLRNALSLLLQLHFHPATEQALRLRQCLSVFLDVFAGAAEPRLQLAAACLPAARAALHMCNSKKNSAALLVKQVLQLLQASQDDRTDQGSAGVTSGSRLQTLLGDTPELVAQQMLWEVEVAAAVTVNKGLQPAKYKPYLSGLLKVVCELPLQPGQADMEALQALADRLSASITDAALCKDVAAVQQHLQQIAAAAGLQDQPQLAPERVEQLIEHFTALSVQQ